MPSRRLIVVGGGQQAKYLRSIAGPNIEIIGFQQREQFLDLISRARALVFAGCEDFGITLAEAQGCGTPVIAFDRGGARDIVVPLGASKQPTGVLFKRQSVEMIEHAVEQFERRQGEILPSACQSNASRFSVQTFRRRLNKAIDRAVETKRLLLSHVED